MHILFAFTVRRTIYLWSQEIYRLIIIINNNLSVLSNLEVTILQTSMIFFLNS